MREQSRSDEGLGVRYLRMALEYGRATRTLLDGNQCEAPFWQSVGHALELSLKSLLKKHGFDEMDLMHFISHDLYGAERSYLRQCPDSELISADASRLIRHLSDYMPVWISGIPAFSRSPRCPTRPMLNGRSLHI